MMERKAPAKINIGLKVAEKRPDGYHNLDSHFVRIPIYDIIYIDIAEGPFSVSVTGNESYVAPGKKDLMEKAAEVYAKESGRSFSLSIRIEKKIPTQAGLGGGSSDAAEVLLALNERYQVFSREELVALSSSVGADVPFFVSGYKAARVGGIGDVLEEEPLAVPYQWCTLYRAVGSGVSTKEAYEKLDGEKRDGKPLPPLCGLLSRKDFPNDFEKVEGTGLLEKLHSYVCEGDFVSLSGSGSVWYVLSMKKKEAKTEEFLVSLPFLE